MADTDPHQLERDNFECPYCKCCLSYWAHEVGVTLFCRSCGRRFGWPLGSSMPKSNPIQDVKSKRAKVIGRMRGTALRVIAEDAQIRHDIKYYNAHIRAPGDPPLKDRPQPDLVAFARQVLEQLPIPDDDDDDDES